MQTRSRPNNRRHSQKVAFVRHNLPTRPHTPTHLAFEHSNLFPIFTHSCTECGIRPQVKSGRIVGGKGATFGEFPWQVLVRESTWLGLFTKNKCGGVLISKNYVVTAAHCQPG